MGFDLTQFLTDGKLQDHLDKPIITTTLIQDFSQKYDIQIKTEIQVFKKGEK